MVNLSDDPRLRRLSAWSAVGGLMRAVQAAAVLGNELSLPVRVTHVTGPLGRRWPGERVADVRQALEA